MVPALIWPEWLPAIPVWLAVPTWVWPTLAAASLLALIGSALSLPHMLAGLPHDLFVHRPQPRPWNARRFFKNAAGAVLIMAGFAMLVLPGQGLLTMLVGLLLSDVPGKRPLAVFFLRRGPIFRAVNAIRARRGKPPLVLPGQRVPTPVN